MEIYQAVFKRNEVKYLLTEAQLAALRPALETHMEPDAFAHSSISNLYYDTPDFRMLRRSQEKPVYKEKLRLRSYGVPDEETQVFPEIKKKAEGIVYKRRVSMPYALNISGGTITAHSDSGDGFDSNGDLTISGGHVTVWTANAADNEPLDADGMVTVSGGTVLAAGGSSGMGMSLAANQPCVIFSGAAEMPGGNMQNGQPGGEERSEGNEQPNGGERPDGEGQPARGGSPGGASLLTQGSAFAVADSNGTALYTGEAIYNASFVFFSSGDLSEGESYTLSSGETQTKSAAQTGTVSTGMGNMGGPGGQKPDGAPPSGGGGGPKPDGDTPRSKPTGEMPQKDSGNAKA